MNSPCLAGTDLLCGILRLRPLLNFNPACLRAGYRQRHADFENAIFERRVDFLRLYTGGKRHRAVEAAVFALASVGVLLLLLDLVPALAGDRKPVVGDL